MQSSTCCRKPSPPWMDSTPQSTSCSLTSQHHPAQAAEGQTGEHAGGFCLRHVGWSLSDVQTAICGGENYLQLNVAKMKEMVADFRRNKPRPLQSALVGQTLTLWIHTNTWVWCWTVYWTGLQTQRQSMKGLSQLYFLRRLRSFNVCNQMLQMFYQPVVGSTIFFTLVSWDAGIKTKDANRLNKLLLNCLLLALSLLTLEEAVEDRMLVKLLAIVDKVSHPLHKTEEQLQPFNPAALKTSTGYHSYLLTSDFILLT